jgi:hypothetical protein
MTTELLDLLIVKQESVSDLSESMGSEVNLRRCIEATSAESGTIGYCGGHDLGSMVICRMNK